MADDETILETEAPCERCGTTITVYNKFVGLLPSEHRGEREASHTWLVCDLHVELNALAAAHKSMAGDAIRGAAPKHDGGSMTDDELMEALGRVFERLVDAPEVTAAIGAQMTKLMRAWLDEITSPKMLAAIAVRLLAEGGWSPAFSLSGRATVQHKDGGPPVPVTAALAIELEKALAAAVVDPDPETAPEAPADARTP